VRFITFGLPDLALSSGVLHRNPPPLLATVLASLAASALLLLPATARSAPRDSPRRLVVGYFGQWGVNADPPYYLRDLADNGGAELLDQIDYAQAAVKGRRCSIAQPQADLATSYTADTSVSGMRDDPSSPFRGYFHQLRELRKKFPKLRILISLEGAAEDFEQDALPENRRAFVASCVDTFLRGHFAPGVTEPGLFDGIDVDWEYPQKKDARNFEDLFREFRRQMRAIRPGLTLAIAVGDHPTLTPGTDFRIIAGLVDQVGMMNYDYSGPWNAHTGLLAPLLPREGAPRDSGSIVGSIAAYEQAGVPRKKILMGLPFYGYQWRDVAAANNGLFQAGKGVAEDKPYRFIRNLTKSYSLFRDERSQAPWLFDGKNFWTFEDPISVNYKVSYAAQQHLAGIMIWELGGDTEEATLLKVAWQALRHPLDVTVVDDLAAEPEPADSGSGHVR
jgi:chitinase